MSKLFILPLLAALITFVAVPVVRQLSQKAGAVAKPGGRRKHKGVVPLCGGIAIFFGFLVASLFLNETSNEIFGYLIGALIIVAIGFLDDIFELPPIAKFFGQILATLIVIASGVRVEFVGNLGSGNDGLYYLGFLSLPITFLWIIGITNAINFLDGLDGLAGGISVIASWTLGIVAMISGRYDAAILGFMLGAAAIAFLPYNFSNNPKRKVFMGDSGSGFLGYSLAVISIMGMTKVAAAISMLVPILILAIPIFDTLFAIVRRLLTGKSPFEADRKHLHYLIKENGLSDHQTVLAIYGITILLSGLAVYSTQVEPGKLWTVFMLAIILFLLFLWRFGILQRKPKVSR